MESDYNMVFGWDDAAVGGIAAAGNIVGGLISAQSSRANADHQMDRQMAARKTAHQDEVADLRAAGLNPVLSAGGSGASTPTMASPEGPDLGGAVGSGVNSALAHQRQKVDLDLAKAQKQLTDFSAQKIDQENYSVLENTKLIKNQSEFQELKNRYMRETLQAQIKEAKAKGDWAQVNMLLGAIGGTSQAIKTFLP